ncbi:MAG: GGDEF domain-containing protein [Elusimicrobiota bacterium]|jgi:diguanylate cyclase (GGDEF)-like protein|nr:GGDEF domain-containing protein [Elusimicrobiota bacterium]
MSIIPLPYYFRNKLKKRKEKYYAISKNLKVKHSCILSSYKESFQVRRRYESFVERIVQNYIIGNKLLKCSSKEIFVQNILSFLKEKKIINGAAIFELTNSNWNILGAFGSISNKNLIPKICYIKDIGRYYEKTLLSKDEDDVENTSKIYLPIVNANELLGAVIVSVQVGELENFIEETSFFIPQISVSLKRLKLFDYINERSRVDGLTGLYTKHYFLQRLEVEMSRQKRYGKGFYILMIDLDFFKCLNDKYGHLFGDKIIHKVAKSIRSSIRRGDLAGRYGGEEFIVFLPTISQKIVRNTAETIRQAVANLEFESNGEKIKVTLSTGVSSNSKKSKNVENIIANADSALYEAKKTGRNKVISYDSM